jgi:hypothetical protein
MAAKRSQALNDSKWGVRLTPEDVRRTGSDFDLGFTYLSIRVLPELSRPIQCNFTFIPTDPNDKSKTVMTVAF